MQIATNFFILKVCLKMSIFDYELNLIIFDSAALRLL